MISRNLSAEVLIAGRRIGMGHEPFIVAEAGINHNGEIEKSFEMIHLAKKIGADAIKFQTFEASEFITDKTLMFTYKSQGNEVTESMLEMFERYQFSREQWFKIKQHCDREGIIFLSTPQNRSDLDLLLEIGIPAVKVGSDDFTNLPLLASYKSAGLPMILSCGMADMGEVYQALDTVGVFDGYPTILLMCVSQYPTPPEDVNLRKLATLSGAFPQLILGFSDHTQGPLASALAVALGACVFEKHFTLGHDLPGPDHWFSEDPDGLREWVNSIRTASVIMGEGTIRPTPSEREMRILARRSLVALRDIEPGEEFTQDNLGLRRPGDGLAPSFYSKVLGHNSARSIASGAIIKLGDIS